MAILRTCCSNKVIIHGNELSQPARSVVWLCKLADIPYEYRTVDLGRGEQLREEYAKMCVPLEAMAVA